MAGSSNMPSSTPLGANGAAANPSQATPTSRGLPSNPAQGVRRLHPSISNMPVPPPPPIPDQYQSSVPSTSNGSLSAPRPMSVGQVLSLARDAMKNALKENESQAAEASGVSTELKPGVTIDLSRKNIQVLPEEVVDIIKSELERLALSHNKLTSLPARFAECTSLRYLNVRNNFFREFPLPLCSLKSLEILDLGRNKIKLIPPEITRLASLKVLAIQKNRVEELPLCLGDMISLHMLKLDGNNITFPPKEIFQVQATSPPNDGFSKESEVTEVTMTAHIKKFLKQKLMEKAERTSETDNGTDDNSEGVETPRFPLKRVVSGRFPIKVNGVDGSELRSPNMPRPPPIPSRSHARGLSQQTTALRKPGVMPLTIGNPNERLRSNSEAGFLATRVDRPAERQRRVLSKRTNELGTLDETQANNRFSHYRGLSHGSSMTGHVNPSIGSIISPNSPAEPLLQRPNYVRRLSVLPEQRRESKVVDHIVESAKGILYAIFQVHPMIQLFTRLTNDGTAKRSSLEIVFFNTNVHVEELEQELLKHESNDGNASRENENVHRAALTLINAYSHICSILLNNLDVIVSNGDPRYIRTLMLCLYNCITELRVTANQFTMGLPPTDTNNTIRRVGPGGTIKPHSRDTSATPTADRPVVASRSRNGTFAHNPSNLRVATDVAIPYVNGTGRTATITSATPRSGESFASTSTEGRYATDVSLEERQFEKIFLSLSKSSDVLMRLLPTFDAYFNAKLREAAAQRAPESVLQTWNDLIGRCSYSIGQTDLMKTRLSTIKFKEPGIRTDPSFWGLCNNFMAAWADFGAMLRKAMDRIILPADSRSRLRPVQLSVKETTQLIMASPWAHIFNTAGNSQDVYNYYSPGHYPTNSNVSQTQLPVTPQSAALGPAVQATVPSTPQSASFANAFSGDVFKRAEHLISMGGLSMSRTNTMTSTVNSAYNNTGTTLTSAQDDRYGLASMLSPDGSNAPTMVSYRRNGGSKPAF